MNKKKTVNISGMILAEECGNARRKTCHIACLFTINPACTGVGSNQFLRGGRPKVIDLSCGTIYGLVHFGFVS